MMARPSQTYTLLSFWCYLSSTLLYAGGIRLQQDNKWLFRNNYDDPYPGRYSGSYQNPNQEETLNNPYFLPTETNVTYSPGERAVLRCRVQHLGTKQITWKRENDFHPLTIGLFTFEADTRITVDYNQRMGEYSLVIQGVQPEDEGVYHCTISTKEEYDNKYEVRLNVRTVLVNGTQFPNLGNPIELVCNATGKPEPPQDVDWYKDGVRIQSNVNAGLSIIKRIEPKRLISVLLIKASVGSDAGNYECRSSNNDAAFIFVHIIEDKAKRAPSQPDFGRLSSASSYIKTSATVLPWTLVFATLLTFNR